MYCGGAFCFGPVRWWRRQTSAEETEKTHLYTNYAARPEHQSLSLCNFQVKSFNVQLIELTRDGCDRRELRVILTSWVNWQFSSVDLSRGATPQHEPLFNFPYSLDSWSENRFHICLIREISETWDEGGWGRGWEWGAGCICEKESEGERGRGERETLGATGYLSRYNGVSYEKTSVNFLSDLQQSITQSSHSADLWSCCLTESCHCSQPPTHRNSNFGLTNFPCNAIQLFSLSPPSLWGRGPLHIQEQRAKPWQCAGLAWGHVRQDRSFYLLLAHPACVNPALKRGYPPPLWWCTAGVTACSALPGKITIKRHQLLHCNARDRRSLNNQVV